MGGSSLWGISPRASIAGACRTHGHQAVVDGCLALLGGDDADAGLVRALGGPRAARFLDAPPEQQYWLRVWALRGLLWAWDERATDAVVAALADEHWRVREMAVKVVARHQVDTTLVRLKDDPNDRVRAAVGKALGTY